MYMYCTVHHFVRNEHTVVTLLGCLVSARVGYQCHSLSGHIMLREFANLIQWRLRHQLLKSVLVRWLGILDLQWMIVRRSESLMAMTTRQLATVLPAGSSRYISRREKCSELRRYIYLNRSFPGRRLVVIVCAREGDGLAEEG
jgi:hypothetical protein